MTTKRRSRRTADMTTRDRLVVAAYRSGRSMREVGKEFGLSHERVRQILVARNCLERHGYTLVVKRHEAAFRAFDDQWGDALYRETTRLGSLTDAVHHLGLRNANIAWVRRCVADRSPMRTLRSYRNHQQQRYTDKQMFAALRRYATPDGRIGGPQYNAARNPDTEPSAALYIKRFSSWSNACALAGLKPLHPGGNRTRQWDRAAIMDALTAYYEHCRKTGEFLTVYGYGEWRLAQPKSDRYPSEGTVRAYGKWTELCHAVEQRVAASKKGRTR